MNIPAGQSAGIWIFEFSGQGRHHHLHNLYLKYYPGIVNIHCDVYFSLRAELIAVIFLFPRIWT